MTARPLDAGTVTALVAEAVTAPSMHNAQPWRFRYVAAVREVGLWADPCRAMPRSDPGNRALHIGCGAALFNLRVAAEHAGLVPEVRLLPEADDPFLLAVVRLGDASDTTTGRADQGSLARLHPAIARRRTSRHPFTGRDVPEEVRATLRRAAADEGAELLFPGSWHIDSVLELVHDAEGRDALDRESVAELARWTRTGADAGDAVDGVPEYAFGPRKEDGRAPLRDFAGRRARTDDRDATPFERDPRLALLSTPGDAPGDWLRAGQALERVLLEATLAGLATSLTSHPLENADLRPLVREPVSGKGHVHMVLRLGYGPTGPATPRRPVRDVLDLA
ncbi:Acg family FMN-binding oxidoreductase [Streptomyces sp. NPDC048172]|uniref:Acg family FMN-binding oxidoreductase n=1 Tax=Streptomyces sp. NPDC048172 TaxID=3365505 RepID=UPI003722B6C9